MGDLLKDLLIEQYIEGVYSGLELANKKLEEFGLSIEMPDKEEIKKEYHKRNKK